MTKEMREWTIEGVQLYDEWIEDFSAEDAEEYERQIRQGNQLLLNTGSSILTHATQDQDESLK